MTGQRDEARLLTERRTLILLVVLCVIAGTLVVLPYLQYILFAVVLAYLLLPAQTALEEYVDAMTAALIVMAGAVLTVIGPSIYVIIRALQQGRAVFEDFQQGVIDTDLVERYLAQWGYEVDIASLTDFSQEPTVEALRRLAMGTINVARGVPDVLIGLTITLFVTFTLLRDGDRLIEWTLNVVPIRRDICRRFFDDIDRLMWASVVGNVAVAAIEAILLTIGLWALGLSNVIFLGVASFILSLLPIVGVFVVWVPVAMYLLVLGQPLAATALILYGSLVSISDMYLRPAVIGHSGALSAAIVIVGIFGGIVVFGAVGLFVGPVILGGAKAALDLYAEEVSAGPS